MELVGGGGARSRERTFCAREMQHWFPPAEHKQPAEWLVGPHSLKVLIGFCVSQEAGWKVISWALPDDDFFCHMGRTVDFSTARNSHVTQGEMTCK